MVLSEDQRLVLTTLNLLVSGASYERMRRIAGSADRAAIMHQQRGDARYHGGPRPMGERRVQRTLRELRELGLVGQWRGWATGVRWFVRPAGAAVVQRLAVERMGERGATYGV